VTDNGRTRFARMRSILEVPILNEKFWSKVPTVAADAIMIDLEDSATPDNKVLARDKILDALAEPEYFGGRQIIVRVNNLSTSWGREDLDALSGAAADVLVCYPKAETASEIGEVRGLLGAGRGLYVMIETARAMIELDRIAAAEGVVGLHFGYVDYAADVGSRPFGDSGDELFEPSNYYAQTKIAVAAAAYGLFATGGTLIPAYRELDKYAGSSAAGQILVIRRASRCRPHISASSTSSWVRRRRRCGPPRRSATATRPRCAAASLPRCSTAR
jgi:citrate lyase beta subunit